ncbi:hypothetical protein F8M41_019224 [Gigaspora margarita]|uniref:Uncharacterized protein n=1 Tax=Gigaspora margarita TaxID=4874 RepID=A0A8H4EKT7_GIGMA|nr:hypothetical protein F8M41_019224 [Gigaspora margarita]
MFPNQSQGFKRLYNNLLADKPSQTLEKNIESQVSRDNTNQTESFGQSSKNTKNITLSHPLERLRILPQMRKNKPANGTQRVKENLTCTYNNLEKGVGRFSPVQSAQRDHKNHEPINQLPIIGDHNKLVTICQTHGAQRVEKLSHDQHQGKSSLPNDEPTTNNHNTTIVMTIKDLEKEIEQYNDNQCINKQTEKLDQHHTDVKNAHRITMPQINKINPTKKYPVYKEQKDI